jgi:hypothetical protein
MLSDFIELYGQAVVTEAHRSNAMISQCEYERTTEGYIFRYFQWNRGFVPTNYAIGTSVVTA